MEIQCPRLPPVIQKVTQVLALLSLGYKYIPQMLNNMFSGVGNNRFLDASQFSFQPL